jgi:hypothetical protein
MFYILPAPLRPASCLSTTDNGMIPPTARRAASSSLLSCATPRVATSHVMSVGRETGAGGNNVTVARLGGGRLQQIRGLSSTTLPTRSALDLALKPKEDIVKGEGKDEEPLGRPEHAVISTFDLFSIGGPYSYPPY